MLQDQPRTEENAAHGLIEETRQFSRLLKSVSDLDPLIDRIGEARFVLLGEASHGTSEYYPWRTHLSSRLIREKGFNFVAVEEGWPDGYGVNRYVKGYRDAGNSAGDVLHAFNRWPTWLWVNWEDAFLFLAETQALHPLHIDPVEGNPPETYPWEI